VCGLNFRNQRIIQRYARSLFGRALIGRGE
jgi:hypothetical protein